MADTFSTSLEFRLQTVGGNNNTWGGFLNTTIENIDTAIHGFIQVSLASADVTLSTAQGRNPVIEVIGTLPANRDLIVKSSVGKYWIKNSTSGAFTVTVKTAAGTGVEVTQGKAALVYCDGTNVELVTKAAGALAELDTVGTAQIDALAVATAELAAEAVTLAKLAQLATDGFIGNDSGGSAVPQLLSATEATALLDVMGADAGSGALKGLVPPPAAGDAVKALLGDADFHLAEDIDATKSAAVDGYVKLPGGFTLQWGRQESVGASTTTITFPIAFTSACYSFVAIENQQGSSGGVSATVALRDIPTTTSASMSTNGQEDIFWMAIGL